MKEENKTKTNEDVWKGKTKKNTAEGTVGHGAVKEDEVERREKRGKHGGANETME